MSIAITRLPATDLEVGQALHRIHRRANDPWFFSGSGDGRFDPNLPGIGACYFSTSMLGAWVETFRTAMILNEDDVLSRSVTTITLDKGFHCADLTHRQALSVGVTGAMTSGAAYGPSHDLADGLQGEFDGVLWRVRHDLEQRLIGVAFFGPEGPQNPNDWPPVETFPIDSGLIREAEDEFGYRVMPVSRT